MAGSFNLFRRYQKTALAALAIMAMLAFFILPPLLQMNAGGGSVANPVVMTWKGGTLREADLDREVLTRRALNQFLTVLRAEATGDDQVRPPLAEGEQAVVRTLLLAREAESNGVVVSDVTVNDFLRQWTQNQITPAQIGGLISQLRERVGFTEQTLFDAIRRLIMASEVRSLVEGGVSLATMPPGWRWDAFCKLEQGATVEVIPIVAELLGDRVAEPKPTELRTLFAEYKDDLPRARSATPGFREPARIRYDALVAPAERFVEEATKDVTEEAIATFYQENKDRLFRAVDEPESKDASPDEKQPAEDDGGEPAASDVPEGSPVEEPSADAAEPATAGESAVDATPAAADAAPAATDEDAADGEPSAGEAAAVSKPAFQTVSFRQPGDAASEEAPAESQKAAVAGEDGAEPAAAGGTVAEAKASESAAGEEDTAASYEPLEKVRETIVEQLARQAASQRTSEIFQKVAGVIARHAEAVEEAVEFEEPLPAAPDLEALAAEHGLEAVQSGLVDASEAVAAGGVGSSVALAFSQEFGVRQQAWVALMFGEGSALWRPVETTDMQGNRYLSWKTEGRPDYTPEFDDVRDEVERVWRLIEARPLARAEAEKIAKAVSEGATMAAAAAAAAEGDESPEVREIGPFTWLTRGTAPFGSPPVLSQPEGLQMPGEEFMEAVFALEPGQTVVAFNEPKTVCYCIRLVALAPDEDTLRSRFFDDGTDARRLVPIANREAGQVLGRWLEDVEERNAVAWKRPPR
jgi:hypothetical protein